MSAEVRPGYKQTEVGVIPSDWDVCCLDDLGELEMGKGLLKSDISQFGDIPAIPYTSLYTDFSEVIEPRNIIWFTSRLTAPYVVNSPCVLLASSSNVSANTGKACALISGLPVAVGREVISFRTKQNVAFISYLLGTKYYRKKTLDLAKGITIRHVYPTTFIDYEIALPSLVEQSAIAEALGDVSALISGLDQLIAKKRDIQQATMQQLLTGQRRLPGFSGEWEVKRLGDVGELISGGTPKTTNPEYWGGDIKWCTPTDITRTEGKYLSETERTISDVGLACSGAKLLPVWALLICTRATIGEIKIATIPVCTNQGFKSLVCHSEISCEFMYYKLLTMKKDMIERAFGSTFLEISKANIEAVEFSIPSAAEQTAIATILSDMDTELAALEARRDKARQLKQGMMQELLTGKTRLL